MKCVNLYTMTKDGRTTVFPCGHCGACIHNRIQDWTFRIKMHQKYANKRSQFLTLTYDDQNLPYACDEDGVITHPELRKREVQLFFKRLRKNSGESKISYICVGEYGTTTWRPHYHVLLFANVSDYHIYKSWIINDRIIGGIHFGRVEDDSIGYVAKFHATKRPAEIFKKIGITPEFFICSKGIGKKFLTKKMTEYVKDKKLITIENGVKLRLPRYYWDKVFTEEELEEWNNEKSKHLMKQRDTMTEEQYDTWHSANVFYNSKIKTKNSKKRKI